MFWWIGSAVVNKWYTSLTLHILSTDNRQLQKSYSCVCKTTLFITVQQSPHISSFHANRLWRHLHLPLPKSTLKNAFQPPLLPYLNQLLTTKPSPRMTAPICFHQTDASRPPSPTVLPTIPYVAVKTLNYKLSYSTCILQHHFPKSVRLNSLTLCTPNPPFFLVKQMVSQKIQGIFLISSLPRPPKENIQIKI